MPQFFSNKRLIVLMVSIIILVALIGFSMSDRERVTWPEQFMRDSVGWVQTIFNKPAQSVAGFFENIQEMRYIYEENKVLKSRLDEYAAVSVERNLLKGENESLKQLIEIEESLNDYQMRPALVIHRTPDRWSEFIGINKGAQHGIEPNMAVINSQGLIGKVNNVSQFSSTVQLLSDHDPTNRVSAMIHGEEPVFGFVEGYDQERGTLLVKKLDVDADIEEDQIVSTSGLGGIFPEGLPIGKVVDVEPDEYGLTANAHVEPEADFYNIDYVMVIERTSTSLDPELIEGDDS
ncbi:rod shape-determining protein MreC [Desertibacillus haloalkaliphilus]|uniref:rod shape-determining protein MreC n=1 Tax=Desertibacillus haloalkaliphilus TaxID=1328930 RepID=UPI001C256236|nr:rod shape-determining protein MreC [Desertibacillus haloalkaliphilus]MBU8905039.1 rod shape-determining protein MreC [Desertibacillus haloalkaliphilus]